MSDDTTPVPPRRARNPRPRTGVATIEDVAAAAGVSVATVSRALRGLPNVAASTRTRVEEVAQQLDYQVDTYASRLATGRNDTVGLAVPHIANWYFSEVAAGAERVLAGAGLDVLLYSVGDASGRRRLLSGPSALRRRLDGLVLIDVLLSAEEVAGLAADGSTVVTVGQDTGEFSSVTIDDQAAAADAVRHLVSLGHTRIALIGSPQATPLPYDVPTERRAGYRDALAEAGLAVDPALEVPGDFTFTCGYEAMRLLLELPEPPTAVFATSDHMAMGAIRLMEERGLDVPADVSVVGFDDQELAAVFELTTVRQDPRWQGESAGRLLLDHLAAAGGSPRSHLLGRTELVVRRTTGAPRRRRPRRGR